jgi:alpha-L-fucosidase
LLLAALLLSGIFSCRAADPSGEQPSSAPAAALERWKDWRFGLFVHFDPSSLTGSEISWSRAGQRRDRNEIVTNGIPAAEYDALYRRFNPTNFNARQWVAIGKAAGVRYLVFTAKHHDGFAMFDSKLTDYKITRSPFGRDLTAELAQACHNAGLGLGFYYSPPDWNHPDFFTPNHARYVQYFHGQVRELLSDYGTVDVLWFDADGGKNFPETWGNRELWPIIRKLQPQILLTKRCGGWGDFDTPEQTIGAFNNTRPWETCMTLCQQWSWKPDDQLKSLKQCLRTLATCAGDDGNLLLNVGPMPDGRVEPRQIARLQEIGAWLKRNGAAIYGTRGGPWKPGAYGVSTRKENTIFVHVFNWMDDTVTLPNIPAKIIAAHLLGGGHAAVRQTENRIVLSVPPAQRDDADTIVGLDLDSSAMTLRLASTTLDRSQ